MAWDPTRSCTTRSSSPRFSSAVVGAGITRELSLPERITPLVKIYRHDDLARFFAACSDAERALFATFLLTGFREQEVMFLRWSDMNFELRTVRVTSKPALGPRRALHFPKSPSARVIRVAIRWVSTSGLKAVGKTTLLSELRTH